MTTQTAAHMAIKPCPDIFGNCSRRQEPVVTLQNFNANSAPHKHVVCHGCGLRGPVRNSEEMAIEAWNTRSGLNPDAIADVVAALRKAIEVADKGSSECPINNGKQRNPSAACTKCGSGTDGNCQSIDRANDLAVGHIRSALERLDAQS